MDLIDSKECCIKKLILSIYNITRYQRFKKKYEKKSKKIWRIIKMYIPLHRQKNKNDTQHDGGIAQLVRAYDS